MAETPSKSIQGRQIRAKHHQCAIENQLGEYQSPVFSPGFPAVTQPKFRSFPGCYPAWTPARTVLAVHGCCIQVPASARSPFEPAGRAGVEGRVRVQRLVEVPL